MEWKLILQYKDKNKVFCYITLKNKCLFIYKTCISNEITRFFLSFFVEKCRKKYIEFHKKGFLNVDIMRFPKKIY